MAPTPWRSRAGGGAVHSINSRPWERPTASSARNQKRNPIIPAAHRIGFLKCDSSAVNGTSVMAFMPRVLVAQDAFDRCIPQVMLLQVLKRLDQIISPCCPSYSAG